MTKAEKRIYNKLWMRRKRAGKQLSRKYTRAGWNNLFKAVRG